MDKRQKLSEEEKNNLINDIKNDGVHGAELARKYKVTPAYVCQLKKKLTINSKDITKYNTALREAMGDVMWLLDLMASNQFDQKEDFSESQEKVLKLMQKRLDNEYFTK